MKDAFSSKLKPSCMHSFFEGFEGFGKLFQKFPKSASHPASYTDAAVSIRIINASTRRTVTLVAFQPTVAL